MYHCSWAWRAGEGDPFDPGASCESRYRFRRKGRAAGTDGTGAARLADHAGGFVFFRRWRQTNASNMPTKVFRFDAWARVFDLQDNLLNAIRRASLLSTRRPTRTGANASIAMDHVQDHFLQLAPVALAKVRICGDEECSRPPEAKKRASDP